MISGRVWKFGDNIDTDVIIPGKYLDDYSPESLAIHAMEGVDINFHNKVSEGDFILAGKNFGIGSSREQAVIAIKTTGVKAIIAESFGRIFYRNAINNGLLAIVCPKCSEIFETGERICIDISKGKVNSSDNPEKSLEFEMPSPIIWRIYKAGGLIPLLRSEIKTS